MSFFPDVVPFLPTQNLYITVLALAVAITALYLKNRKSNVQYPPGPPKTFLLGNMLDIPITHPWKAYTEMAKTYGIPLDQVMSIYNSKSPTSSTSAGDVVHLEVFGDHIIVLSSFEAVRDLLDKRSSIYSNRPYTRMLDLMNWNWTTALKPYGPAWQRDRRIFMQQLRAPAVIPYRPVQTRKITEMLYGFLSSPQDPEGHYKTASVGTVLSIMYGYETGSSKDGFVSLSEDTVKRLSMSAFPVTYAVNTFGFLQYAPEWFPGASFKRYVNESRGLVNRMRESPLEYVQENFARGAPSLVSELLANSQSKEENETIKEFAATSYSAGADATNSVLSTFFQAMVMYPDVQKKAQEEIDQVIGSDRLVTYEDKISLPYLEAVFREVLRWKPTFPLGVPHATTKEDTYRGYYIPKGTVVISNIMALTQNPEQYPYPGTFNPDRFFNNDGTLNNDDMMYAFGFGRRLCPGRHLAIDTIWLVMASVLATFNIQKKKNSLGGDIPVSSEYSDGLLVHPLPFVFSVAPRSSDAVEAIMNSVAQDI